MRLQACVNGARRPGEHAALPVTATELAADVRAVAVAGAEAVHLHVKDGSGADTLDGPAVAEVLTAVRALAPGLPVGITTGAWAEPDAEARLAAVRGWTVLPDFASVNWHEPGSEELAALLLERGVGVEAGLWHEEAVLAWERSPLRGRCLRVLLELPDGLDGASTDRVARQLHRAVGRVAGPGIPVLLHGEGSSCWPALRHAAAAGLPTRIGLEDTLELPDGSPAPGNDALVRAARRLLAGGGRSGTRGPFAALVRLANMPDAFAVLLRNHQAGGRAAVDLFARAARAQRGRPWAEELERLGGEAREDLAFNERVMRRLGVSPSPVQVAALRVGERVGRLKPNGALVRRAPLSDVIELEGLIATVHVKMAGWQAGQVSGRLQPEELDELDRLLDRARTQAERLTALHREAAASALGTPS